MLLSFILINSSVNA